jgi:hypothetical protein
VSYKKEVIAHAKNKNGVGYALEAVFRKKGIT